MKKLSILGLFIFALISFNSCETEDDIVFIAQPPVGFEFTNSILNNYILSQNTASNLGERFTWNDVDLAVPTNVSYELQRSIIGDFSDMVSVNTTNSNEIALTIGQMLNIANEAGLDNDPDSPAPNTGSFSVRLRAFAGDSGTEASDTYSNVLVLNVEILENTGGGGSSTIQPSPWGVVGSGYNDWGAAGLDGQFYTTSEPGVIVAYVTLIEGEIKFRTDNDWGSGDDLGDANNDGVLDQDPDNNIAVTAGDYKITINTDTNAYSIEEFSWGVVGSGYNDWGNAGPDGKFYYDYTTDTFKVGIRLIDGDIKFRQNNQWDVNFGGSGLSGSLEAGGGGDIAVTAGHYAITLNFNDNSYTIESSNNIWGVVGSGFNDWGGAGPDFALTEIQPNILVGDIATFVEGEVKFRTNNDWGSGDDLGDANNDGILDQDPDNNISVAAGLYRVRVNLMDNSYALNKIQ